MKKILLLSATLLLFLGACQNSDVNTATSPGIDDNTKTVNVNQDELKQNSEKQNGILVPSSTELPLDKIEENTISLDSSYITWYINHQAEFIKAANKYYQLLKYVQITDDSSSDFKEEISNAQSYNRSINSFL